MSRVGTPALQAFTAWPTSFVGILVSRRGAAFPLCKRRSRGASVVGWDVIWVTWVKRRRYNRSGCIISSISRETESLLKQLWSLGQAFFKKAAWLRRMAGRPVNLKPERIAD